MNELLAILFAPSAVAVAALLAASLLDHVRGAHPLRELVAALAGR